MYLAKKIFTSIGVCSLLVSVALLVYFGVSSSTNRSGTDDRSSTVEQLTNLLQNSKLTGQAVTSEKTIKGSSTLVQIQQDNGEGTLHVPNEIKTYELSHKGNAESVPSEKPSLINNGTEATISLRQNITTPTKVAVDPQLPRHLIPYHYNLELRPDFYSDDPADFLLEGNVTISLDVQDTTDTITLNVRDLRVFSEAIRVWVGEDASGSDIEVLRTEEDPEAEVYRIILHRELNPGSKVHVFISYTAPLKKDLNGVYYSTYYEDGKLRYMVVSDFETNDARKAYPCLDQPDLKALFSVRLWRKQQVTSLSNMQRSSTETRGDWLIDHYERTPVPMSTYLTAFAWADYGFLDQTTTAGLKEKYIRVWGPPSAKNTGQLDYANNISGAILDGLESLFGVPYDFYKLDNIPVREYGAGAMENWGLIIYDDTRLMLHPNYSSYYDQQQIARTMAHEMVHMWFGDKVTCEWWDDVFLHETFAAYYEHYGASRIDTEADWDHIFLAQTAMNAHVLDDNGQASPIHGHITSLQELQGALSTIVYDKGSTVIRMLRKFIFEDDASFNRAQTNYLATNEHGNTNYHDLINAWKPYITSDLPIDVATLVESWILQTGHPVITLTRDHSSHCARIHVSQTMFRVDPYRPIKELYPAKYNYTWTIPFSYSIQDNGHAMQTVWLNTSKKSLDESALTSERWLLCNPGWFGFYRLNYDEHNWQLLIQQLSTDHTLIDPKNRAQLIFDSIALAQSGLASATLPIRLTTYLTKETEYLPWTAANVAFSRLDSVIQSTPLYGAFRTYIRESIQDMYTTMGWAGDNVKEGQEKSYLRTLLVELACQYMDEQCLDEASKQFDVWILQGERSALVVDPALREVIACSRLAHRSRPGDWQALYAVYQEVRDVHRVERSRVRNALACTTDVWQLQRYADLALNRSLELHADDPGLILTSIEQNPVGRDLIWSLLDQHWKTIPAADRTKVLSQLTNYFTTPYRLEQFKRFSEDHPSSTEAESNEYEANRYKIEASIRWRDRILESEVEFNNLLSSV